LLGRNAEEAAAAATTKAAAAAAKPAAAKPAADTLVLIIVVVIVGAIAAAKTAAARIAVLSEHGHACECLGKTNGHRLFRFVGDQHAGVMIALGDELHRELAILRAAE